MAVASVFDQTVLGRVPKSTNMAVAEYWNDDGVPRPDVSLSVLKWLSLIPGAPDLYARSVVTGLLKMGTLGGGGLWWLWDIVHLWTESDRVLKYGMSTPFGHWGIAQGMITDKPSVYKTNASYSLWLIGIIFGFVGIDSLVASNGGQFLRKLVEFFLFASCLGTIISVWSTGITFGWICAFIFGSFLASIIIAEYISVISAVFGGNIFSDGIHFTNKQDKQYNGFFSWLIKNTSFTDERKAQIIKDLQYGGIPADEIVKMFKIMHPTETKAEQTQEKSNDGDEGSSSWVSFFLLMAAPFLIIWNGIMYVAMLIKEGVTSVTPWYPAILAGKIAAIIGLKTAGLEPMAEQVGLGPMMKIMGPVGGLKLGKLGDIANKMVSTGKEGGLASGLMGQAKSLVGEKAGQVSSLVGEKAGQAKSLASGDLMGKASSLASGDLMGKASSLASGDLMGKASSLVGEKSGDLMGKASSLLPIDLKDGEKFTINNPLQAAKKAAKSMTGGSLQEEPLSAESQIFGAVTVALISGGVIKSLVDYLVAE